MASKGCFDRQCLHTSRVPRPAHRLRSSPAHPVVQAACKYCGTTPNWRGRVQQFVSSFRLHYRRSGLLLQAAAQEVAAAADETELPDLPQQWQSVLTKQANGETVSVSVRKVNKGGVVVDVLGLAGFIPYSKMDAERTYGVADDTAALLQSADQIAPGAEDVLSNGSSQRFLDLGAMQSLIGTSIRAKIVQVDIPQSSIVLSERAALTSDLVSSGLKPGSIIEGTVRHLTDFGAFVSLRGKDGHMHGAEGLIHISELSWDRVTRPESVVQPGDKVICKIMRVDEARSRIALSLKRMDQDPLKQRLEDVLPLDRAEKLLQVPADIPASIESICNALDEQDGIEGVILGRQVEEKRAVSQDLELWISREAVEDGYNLVARAERIVQELHVTTKLSSADMKSVVQRVLQSLV